MGHGLCPHVCWSDFPLASMGGKGKRGKAEKVKGGKENGKGRDWEAGGKQL